MSAWWAGLPAAEAHVLCGGASHRIRWSEGRLEAPDHGDVEQERTLAALGGERCRCIDVLDMWQRCDDDLTVLTLGGRGGADRPRFPAEEPDDPRRMGGSRRRMVATLAIGPAQRVGGQPAAPGADEADPERERLALLALGGGVADRLQATVIAAWTERLAAGDVPADAMPRLEAALHGRLSAALAAWLGEPARLETTLVPEGAGRGLSREDDGRILAEMPFGWLLEAWVPGLTVLLGRFCLAAAMSPDGALRRLITVGPDFTDRADVTITVVG